MPRAKNTFEGAPCKDCGGALRYVSNNTCVACRKAYRRLEYVTFTKEYKARSRQWHESNRDRHNEMMRAGQLRRKFGITIQQYDAMAAEQNNCCAICGLACITSRKLAVDHCHATDKIRGLLCNNCNIGIGKFQDDPAILERALAYVLASGSRTATLRAINASRKNKATTCTSDASEVTTRSSDALEYSHSMSSAAFTIS